MEDCEKHLLADGQVQRSRKEDGKVKRVRKCMICEALYGTTEMTDDVGIIEDVERAKVMEAWRRQRDYYRDIVIEMRLIKSAVINMVEGLEKPEPWEQEDEE